MIDDEKYKSLLDSGLTLDHYVVLCNLNNGVANVKNKRVQGFINLLTKKEYIDDENKITEKGKSLIENCLVQSFNTDDWKSNLYKKCKDKLIELTGNPQVRPEIKGVKYSYLPNDIDFFRKIDEFTKHYKFRNYEKIEKAILAFIDKCYKENRWFPLMKYYIIKDKNSELYTDITEPKEEIPEPTSTQKFI